MKWILFDHQNTLEILNENRDVIVKWEGFDGLKHARKTASAIVDGHNLLSTIGDMLKFDISQVEMVVQFTGKKTLNKRIKEWKNILNKLVKLCMI